MALAFEVILLVIASASSLETCLNHHGVIQFLFEAELAFICPLNFIVTRFAKLFLAHLAVTQVPDCGVPDHLEVASA